MTEYKQRRLCLWIMILSALMQLAAAGEFFLSSTPRVEGLHVRASASEPSGLAIQSLRCDA